MPRRRQRPVRHPLLHTGRPLASGIDEFGWPGTELHIGDVVIAFDSRRGRCPMTTVDPDTLEVNRGVLKDITARFDENLAPNAELLRPGTICVGDTVELVRPTGTPSTMR